MVPSASTVEPDDRANELYWGSDRSVNQIAEELDLSKGALYGMIRPLAAAMGCPRCGREVVHANRTAKERALVDCPACQWHGSEDGTIAAYEPFRPDAGDGAGNTRPPARPSHERPNRGRTHAARATDSGALVAAGLLGAAAGLALILWAWRRWPERP